MDIKEVLTKNEFDGNDMRRGTIKISYVAICMAIASIIIVSVVAGYAIAKSPITGLDVYLFLKIGLVLAVIVIDLYIIKNNIQAITRRTRFDYNLERARLISELIGEFKIKEGVYGDGE